MARRVHGEGSVYQRASDKRWFYSVDLGWQGGKRDRRTVSATTLKALRPKMRALDEKVRAGIDADGTVTLAWWLNWWLAEISPNTAKSPQTRKTYRGYIDNWIVPHLGARRLDQVKPDHLRALYRAMREDGKSPATQRQVHAILSAALKVAENDGKILRSPARAVTLPKPQAATHGKLTIAEARAVLTVLAGRPDRSRWYAALLLGLRQGEALGLAWDDVDLDHGILRVRQSLSRVGGEFVLGPVKSRASNRALPILPELHVALLELDHSGPLVWGPLGNRADYNAWQALLAAAGVPPRPLHAARATTASLLDEFGVSPKVISEILGHAQASTTSAHYIHGDIVRHQDALSHLSGLIEG